MRKLFDLDKKDYGQCTSEFVRNAARSIVIKAGKVAMIHSLKYDYYKFPGGGIEKDETPIEAMIRETLEEVGLVVKPETVHEYGFVHRVQRSWFDPSQKYIQDNYYYLCEVEDTLSEQDLVDYEADEGFTLEWVEPNQAIKTNREKHHGPKDALMIEREARVLEMLLNEGLV